MKNNKAFLENYMTLRKQAGKKNSDILNGYLSLIPKKDLLKDSVINIIIEYEDKIDGEGYKIITSYENTFYVKMHTKEPMMGYNMYVAALDIISSTASNALRIKDRGLLNKSLIENMRVLENKDKAKMQNEAMIKMFENSTKVN